MLEDSVQHFWLEKGEVICGIMMFVGWTSLCEENQYDWLTLSQRAS